MEKTLYDNKLTEILEETTFTQEEYQIYKKVLKHYQAEDLQYRLEDRLENEEITREEYDKAIENAEEIIERYDDTNNADWESVMDNAIDWVMGDVICNWLKNLQTKKWTKLLKNILKK